MKRTPPKYEMLRSIPVAEIKRALGLADTVDLVVDDVSPDGRTVGLMRLVEVRAIQPVVSKKKKV